MLAQRHRQWANISTSLGQRVVSAVYQFLTIKLSLPPGVSERFSYISIKSEKHPYLPFTIVIQFD